MIIVIKVYKMLLGIHKKKFFFGDILFTFITFLSFMSYKYHLFNIRKRLISTIVTCSRILT